MGNPNSVRLFAALLAGVLALPPLAARPVAAEPGSGDSPTFALRTRLANHDESPIFSLDTRGAAGVEHGPAASAFWLAAAFPNPGMRQVTIRYALPRAGPAELAVLDLDGRRIRELGGVADGAAGLHEVVWDGLDTSGRPVAAGVYFVRLRCGSQMASQRLALIR